MPNISAHWELLPERSKKWLFKFVIGSERRSEKRRKNSKPDKKAHPRCRINAIRFSRKESAEWREPFVPIRLSVWKTSRSGTNAIFRILPPKESFCRIQV